MSYIVWSFIAVYLISQFGKKTPSDSSDKRSWDLGKPGHGAPTYSDRIESYLKNYMRDI